MDSLRGLSGGRWKIVDMNDPNQQFSDVKLYITKSSITEASDLQFEQTEIVLCMLRLCSSVCDAYWIF